MVEGLVGEGCRDQIEEGVIDGVRAPEMASPERIGVEDEADRGGRRWGRRPPRGPPSGLAGRW